MSRYVRDWVEKNGDVESIDPWPGEAEKEEFMRKLAGKEFFPFMNQRVTCCLECSWAAKKPVRLSLGTGPNDEIIHGCKKLSEFLSHIESP